METKAIFVTALLTIGGYTDGLAETQLEKLVRTGVLTQAQADELAVRGTETRVGSTRPAPPDPVVTSSTAVHLRSIPAGYPAYTVTGSGVFKGGSYMQERVIEDCITTFTHASGRVSVRTDPIKH